MSVDNRIENETSLDVAKSLEGSHSARLVLANNCHQLSGNIIAPNYAAGAFVAFCLNESSKKIYTLDGLWNYSKSFFQANGEVAQSVFLPDSINGVFDKVYVLQEVEDYSCKQIVVGDVTSLIEALQDAKYIACDDSIVLHDLLNATDQKFNHVLQYKWSESLDCTVWRYIIELMTKPYSSCSIRKIMAITNMQDRELLDNVFPYVQYSPVAKHPFVKKIEQLIDEKKYIDLFELIAQKKPIWRPIDVDKLVDEFKEFQFRAIMIEKYETESDRWIIEKSLAQFFDDVIYVGKTPVVGVKTQIIYEHGYVVESNQWEHENISISINCASEQKMALQGKIGSLMASNLGVLESEKSLYAYIKNCVIEEIRASLCGISNAKNSLWKDWLMFSGLDYIKILHKTKLFYDTFFEWYQSCAFDSYQFYSNIESSRCIVYVDFCAKKDEKLSCVKFFWNVPNVSDIYRCDYAMAQLAAVESIKQIIIIAPGKVVDLDLKKEFEARRSVVSDSSQICIIDNFIANNEKDRASENNLSKRVRTKQDDLFYWNKFYKMHF